MLRGRVHPGDTSAEPGFICRFELHSRTGRPLRHWDLFPVAEPHSVLHAFLSVYLFVSVLFGVWPHRSELSCLFVPLSRSQLHESLSDLLNSIRSYMCQFTLSVQRQIMCVIAAYYLLDFKRTNAPRALAQDCELYELSRRKAKARPARLSRALSRHPAVAQP
jgi:hypothetical protein